MVYGDSSQGRRRRRIGWTNSQRYSNGALTVLLTAAHGALTSAGGAGAGEKQVVCVRSVLFISLYLNQNLRCLSQKSATRSFISFTND